MNKLAVILSQSPGDDPRKRGMEAALLAALGREPDVAVAVVPHLYDLREADAAVASLRAVAGPLVVLAWIYPRAIHWTLDSLGIRGRCGDTRLRPAGPEIEKPKARPDAPARPLWSLDLRDEDDIALHVAEIQRILGDVRAASEPASALHPSSSAFPSLPSAPPPARWYPVIDFGRCNGCMECLDFCLFGVYGVDDDGHVLVENPENCKKGCPACSRVCPEHAILFPMHRVPAIAGAPGAGMAIQKLDLSELFGAPSASQLAAAERTAALADARQEAKPKDNLDKLMDALDNAKL